MKTVSLYHTFRVIASSLDNAVISFFTKQSRFLYWAPVFLALGIGLYFSLDQEPDLLTCLLLSLSLGGVTLALRRRLSLRFLMSAFFLMSLGVSTATLRTHLKRTPLLTQEHPPQWMEGTLSQREDLPSYQRITLKEVRITSPEAEKMTLPAVRLSLRGRLKLPPDFLPGDRLRVKAALLPPPGPFGPGGYNFRQFAFFKGLSAVGYAVTPARLLSSSADVSFLIFLEQKVARFRQNLTHTLQDSLGGLAGQLAAALVTGDRAGIPEEVRHQFASSGTAHLLSISGLHLSVVAGFFFMTLRFALALIPRLSLHFPIKKWAAVLALVGTFAYLLICGAPLPAQRAFFMSTLVLGAVVLDRSALTLRNICLAAFVILALFPESLLSVSFQLSFAATLALVAAYEAFQKHRSSVKNPKTLFRHVSTYFWGVMVTSLIATLATTPFLMQTFHRLTLYGVVANLLAVPWTSFILIPTLLAYLFCLPFGAPESLTFFLTKGLETLILISKSVANLPGAVILTPPTSSIFFFLMVGSALWICLIRGRLRLFGLPPLMMAACLWGYGASPPDIYLSGDLKVIALRSEDGHIYLPSRQAGRFARESFQSLTASQASKTLPTQPKDLSPDLVSLGEGRYLFKKALMIRISEKPRLKIQDLSGNPLLTLHDKLDSQGIFLWVQQDRQTPESPPLLDMLEMPPQNRPWS